uniref:Uncharacterized protein n=1 Tax=Ignisphaera aggregans TaxID=334771 RepID=A0A7J3Z7V4_9CREN
MSELKLDRPWRKRVNVKVLSGEARRILEKVRGKLGYNKTEVRSKARPLLIGVHLLPTRRLLS